MPQSVLEVEPERLGHQMACLILLFELLARGQAVSKLAIQDVVLLFWFIWIWTSRHEDGLVARAGQRSRRSVHRCHAHAAVLQPKGARLLARCEWVWCRLLLHNLICIKI